MPTQFCSPRKYASFCFRRIVERWKEQWSVAYGSLPGYPRFSLKQIDIDWLKQYRRDTRKFYAGIVDGLIDAGRKVEFVDEVPRWMK